MDVVEILKDVYTGQQFPGFEDINLTFNELKDIIKNEKRDWKSALENIKGVYLLTDERTNKRYVGSAYGNEGIWSRWSCYINTGNGGNKELKKLEYNYIEDNFNFTLLEYRPFKTDDKSIIKREQFWKEVLLTQGNYGYNNN